MKDRLRGISGWLSTLLLVIASIAVYKTFDNFMGIVGILSALMTVLTPFIIGLVFAYLLLPLSRRIEVSMEKSKNAFVRKRRRGLAVSISYIIFLLLLGFFIAILIPPLWASAIDLIGRFPEYYEIMHTNLEAISDNALFVQLNIPEFLDSLSLENTFGGSYRLNDIRRYMESLGNATSAAFSWIMGLVACAYILSERTKLRKTFDQCLRLVFPPKKIDFLYSLLGRIDSIFSRFLMGKIIDSIIIGVLATIGFYILRLNYSLLMGVITAIFNVIPYFGPFIGAVPVIFLTFVGSGPIKGIWVTAFIIVLQQFDGIVLGPKILGDSLGISPFWILFSVLVGGGILGFWGMLLGAPIAATIRMFFIDYVEYRNRKQAEL